MNRYLQLKSVPRYNPYACDLQTQAALCRLTQRLLTAIKIIYFTAITIGFNSINYYVNECEGQVHIKVEVIGSLQRAVVIHLSTTDKTAAGKPDDCF